MADVTVTLRVVKPWWLGIVARLRIATLFVRGLFAGREITEADYKPFADWLGRQIKVVVD